MEMDSSFSESDSPNTIDRRRFRVVSGAVTEEERNFCIRQGLLELGEDGEYHELSTLMDSVIDVSTDEEDAENVEPAEPVGVEIKEGKDVGDVKGLTKSKAKLSKRVSFNCTADSSFGTSNHSMQLRSACRKSEYDEGTTSTTIQTPSRVLTDSGANAQSPVVLHFTKFPRPSASATPQGHSDRISKLTTPSGPAASTPVAPRQHPHVAPILLETTGLSDNQSISAIKCPTTFSSPLDITTGSPGPAQEPPGQESLSALRIPALFQTPAASEVGRPTSRRKLNSTVNFIDVSFTDVDQIADIANDSSFLRHEAEVEAECQAAEGKDDRKMILRDISVDSIEDNFAVGAETEAEADVENTQEIPEVPEVVDVNVEVDIETAVSVTSKLDDVVDEAVVEVVTEAPLSETPTICSVVSVDVKSSATDVDNILIMEDIEEIISEASNSIVVAVTVTENVTIQNQNAQEPIGVVQEEISEVSDIATDGSSSTECGVPPVQKTLVEGNATDVDDFIREEYAVSPAISANNAFKGIDAISPSCVAEDISLNDTADSLADISLDDISNGSFNLEEGKGDFNVAVPAARESLGDSFTTCASQASTGSYGSCEGEEVHRAEGSFGNLSRDANSSNAKSFEDLDDTITLMEKLLHQADQLEEQELQETAMEHEFPDTSGFEEIQLTPQKQTQGSLPSTPATKQCNLPGFPEILPSPSVFGNAGSSPVPVKSVPKKETDMIFATPAGPAPKARMPASPMADSHYFSPSSNPKLATKGQGVGVRQSPTGPTTTTTPAARITRNSPSPVKARPVVLSSPTLSSPSKPQTIPKVKVTPKRLKSILDSPGSRVVAASPSVPSVRKLNSPNRALKTPVTRGATGLPISSPVANYIHAVPTPTQIRRMGQPPKYQPPPPPPSPRGVQGAGRVQQHPTEQQASHDLDLNGSQISLSSRLPRPKSSLHSTGGLDGEHKLAMHFRGKESLGCGLPKPKKLKELAPKFYVGPDQIKPVSGSSSVSTPSYGPSKSHEITPVSQRHLGKRDSNNASMVNQQAVTRKFCPERFGFQSHK